MCVCVPKCSCIACTHNVLNTPVLLFSGIKIQQKSIESLNCNEKFFFFSGQNGRVFVYFTDHGAENLICFPNDNLFADDLTNALKSIQKKTNHLKR